MTLEYTREVSEARSNNKKTCQVFDLTGSIIDLMTII